MISAFDAILNDDVEHIREIVDNADFKCEQDCNMIDQIFVDSLEEGSEKILTYLLENKMIGKRTVAVNRMIVEWVLGLRYSRIEHLHRDCHPGGRDIVPDSRFVTRSIELTVIIDRGEYDGPW